MFQPAETRHPPLEAHLRKAKALDCSHATQSYATAVRYRWQHRLLRPVATSRPQDQACLGDVCTGLVSEQQTGALATEAVCSDSDTEIVGII